MSTPAVVMMVVAMLVLWGGLALAVLNISRTGKGKPDRLPRER